MVKHKGRSGYTTFYPDDVEVWDDFRFAPATLKPLGSGVPNYVKFADDGGGSTGVYAYHFDDTAEEQLNFEVQLPHRWKEGSAICFHVHWFPLSTNTGTVIWGLEIPTFVNDGDAVPSTTTIYTGTETISTGVARKTYRTEITELTLTGKTISALSAGRLFRDAGNDNYSGDVVLLSFDFHYISDAAGSLEELAK